MIADANKSEPKVYIFPDSFLWGAATSSHQVEGENRWNDWWEFEQAGRLPHRSGEACRHFDLYERDFDMARSWGHNAHRFSIEWSRIEPRKGEWNREAITHYRYLIRALRQRGMEPVLTLHHFTNPAWFTREGGWIRRDNVRLFERYVAFVAQNLGQDVRYWVTINEPTVYAKRAYIQGDWPPCQKRSWSSALIVLRNMARAHISAYHILHRHRPDSQVGLAHSAPYVVPCNVDRRLDRWSTGMRDFVLNRLFFQMMGASREKCFDFLGLNYYARHVVHWNARGQAALFGAECVGDHHDELRRFSSVGWEIFPRGLKYTLENFSRFKVPLMITENGVATQDEALRIDYLKGHLQALAEAIGNGINVLGYFYWTLMDNYEWTEGMTAHFGLAAVDFSTQERQPRPCAEYFALVCKTHRLVVSD